MVFATRCASLLRCAPVGFALGNFFLRVISGSRSTSRCNQLCGEDAQRRCEVGNEDACRVLTCSQ